MTCPDCGTDQHLSVWNSTKVCENCGLVIEEDTINTGFHDSTAGHQWIQEASPRFQARLVISSLCSALGVDQLSKEVMFVYDQVIDKTGKTSFLFPGCCIYVVSRRRRIALSLGQISRFVPCSPFDLGRAYNKVKTILGLQIPEIDPALYLEPQLGKLMMYHGVFIDSTAVLDILSKSVQLVHLARDAWLISGRNPEPVALASLVIVLNYKGQQLSVKQASKTCGLDETTLSIRINEIKKVLCGLMKTLPWGNSISSHTVVKYLGDFFQYYNVMGAANVSNPPAYDKSRAKERDRKAQIACIQAGTASGNQKYLDRQIRRLLELGVGDEEILEMTDNNIIETVSRLEFDLDSFEKDIDKEFTYYHVAD